MQSACSEDLARDARSSSQVAAARVKPGELDAARLTFERQVLPVLRGARGLEHLSLLVDRDRETLSTVATWTTREDFAKVAKSADYQRAMDALTAHLVVDDYAALRSDDVEIRHLVVQSSTEAARGGGDDAGQER
mmetsp:Transcript_3795/g.14984  ORF Transcript_3795/g.14984 Transcript_3795/m.14984 type:complete len:135 (+) Transcript_3795:1761-2165(+)